MSNALRMRSLLKAALKTVVTIVVAVFALSGCAMNQALSPEKYNALERVGVVSKIGGTFYKRYTGVTMFTNTIEEVDISGWQLDAEYERQLLPVVESLFGVEAIALPDERGRFDAVNTLNGPWSAPAFWPPNFKAIRDEVISVCQENDIDTVLMITENNLQDPFDYTNQFARGVGLFERNDLYVVHVIATAGMLDCVTGKPLSTPWLVYPDDVEGASRTGFVAKEVEGLPRRFEYSAWTEKHKAALKKHAFEIPQAAWEETLKRFIPVSE